MCLLIPFLCPYLLLLLSSLKYLLSIYDLLSIVSVTWADGFTWSSLLWSFNGWG